jgi:hypothetical protein
MYDFHKVEILNMPINAILKNPYLKIIGEHDGKSFEVDESKVLGSYLGIPKFCKVQNNRYIDMQFSFHKLFNGGDHNYNDFTITDFFLVLKDLTDKFEINPFQAILHNIEFGVNITLPIKVETFLNAFINFKGKDYDRETFNRNGLLLRFNAGQYEVKIYDKGKQYGLGENILRFEIKVTKMQFLRSKGINIRNYSDLLNPLIIEKLSNLLLNVFNQIVIYDTSININKIKNKRDKMKLLLGKNPLEWLEIQNSNNYKSKRKIFRELNLKYGTVNMQSVVFDLLVEKLKMITEITISTQKHINDYLSRFERADHTGNYQFNKLESIPEITYQL